MKDACSLSGRRGRLPMVELAWRGRTHPAMALAGGVSLSMLRGLSRVQKAAPSGSRRCWAVL